MKVTGWDRFLMSFAPRWALDRVRVRAAAETLARHYEAASPGRRTENWARNYGDADNTIRPALVQLRNHARDLVRNNAWAKRGQRVIANNTIGTGIRPQAVSDQAEVAAQAMKLWNAWASTTECESEGRHTFYGLQHLAVKSIYEAGEVLIRKRPRRAKDALTIPLQLQVLEADHLDHSRTTLEPSLAGGPTIQGVEFDKLGRRAAYWLFPVHPGSGRNTEPARRVPASEVLHVYYAERSGQTRGVSWLGNAIVAMKDLDVFDDAELEKQKVAACFAAFVTDTMGAPPPIGEPSTTNPLVETFEPGMISELPPGKSITFATPPSMTSDSLAVRTLRRMAAGIGVTYEDLTGDYSNVNFSSARMARLSHWGNVNDWQTNMLIPLFCQGVWDWAMEAAVIAGELPAQPGATWTTPPMPMIEPDKEGLAVSRRVRNGMLTLSGMAREQGLDPETHFAELAADFKKADALGLVLDCDPRKTTAAGQEQASETQINAPPPPKPAPAGGPPKPKT
jgi:lambda family phage portal protein